MIIALIMIGNRSGEKALIHAAVKNSWWILALAEGDDGIFALASDQVIDKGVCIQLRFVMVGDFGPAEEDSCFREKLLQVFGKF